MLRAWNLSKQLLERNARHVRKGYRLKDAGTETSLKHAAEELVELALARTEEEAKGELGDVIGCLFCYAHRMGWSMEELEKLMVDKFDARFEVT